MLAEVINGLKVNPQGVYVDCTVGGGGHSRAILEHLEGGILVGLDQDPEALAAAAERLQAAGSQYKLVKANFNQLAEVLDELAIEAVDGILYDLGVSSYQLDKPERGFSYQHEAPLDMRMDPLLSWSAADLVNELSAGELAAIIKKYGEERWAARIAEFIIRERAKEPIRTTGQLVRIIKDAIPASARRSGSHPAKRTFQALRIAVNNELGVLENSLQQAVSALRKGGRICVISYHSLEDRIVKDFFRKEAATCICPPGLPVCRCDKVPRIKLVTRKPLFPSEAEVTRNPRARSARLRIAEKLDVLKTGKGE